MCDFCILYVCDHFPKGALQASEPDHVTILVWLLQV